MAGVSNLGIFSQYNKLNGISCTPNELKQIYIKDGIKFSQIYVSTLDFFGGGRSFLPHSTKNLSWKRTKKTSGLSWTIKHTPRYRYIGTIEHKSNNESWNYLHSRSAEQRF